MVAQENEKQRVYQATLEFWKMTFEYFKTFATICLASIAAFAALLAGAFDTPPSNVTHSMFSLIGCSNPVMSWFGTHRWIFWMCMAVLIFVVVTFVVVTSAGVSFWKFVAVALVVFISAGVCSLLGTPIPCLSPTRFNWFADNRSIWMLIPFVAFIAAGLVSLAGTHYCRKALWDLRSVTDEDLCNGKGTSGKYRWLILLRMLVWLSYGVIATVDFFIIALLSIRR